MKKIIFSAAIVSALMLGACGSEEADQESAKEENVEVKSNTESTETAEVEEKEDEPEGEKVDGPLTEPGQWTMDGESKVTLVKMKELNQTYEVGPMKVTIESVKLLKNENISAEFQEALNSTFSKDVGDAIATLQFIYKVENTSDQDIMFNAFNMVTTDTKTQIDGMYNLTNSDDNGVYFGKVVVDGLMVLPYLNDDIENVNRVTVSTGTVLHNDELATLADAIKIDIDFN